MLESRRQRGRCVLCSFAAAATSFAAVALPGSHARAVPVGEQAEPCRSEQVAVTASPTDAAVGHRSVTLTFSLAGGAEPCTLTGYPAIETAGGGPDIHAKPTLRGYLGGLPSDADVEPTVTLGLAAEGQAIVEGMAVDRAGNPCPTYTALRVNPPNTVIVLTVPATIDACELQVHPVTALLQ